MDIAIGLIGGLGLFLFGMNYMGDGLQKAAGEKMKNILAVLTKNKFMGLIVGTLVTMVIQSSSATTVMTVGFVNAGLMNLQQAIGIIMGANIGTTITALLVTLSIDKIAPIFIGLGVFLHMMSREKKVKDISEIMIGFGILFLGMNVMKGAVEPLKNSSVFLDILSNLKNPFLGILAGFGITAILQSSSATTGLLIAVASGGGITLDMALPIIFGQNIGTCVTALISSIGASKNAKRAAVMHILFNVIGTLLFLILLAKPITSAVMYFVNDGIERQIAVSHILFNVINVIVLFPFSNLLVNIATKFVSGEDEQSEEKTKYIDDRLLATPAIALAQIARETLRMGKIVVSQLSCSIEAFLDKNEKKALNAFEIERQVNTLAKKILTYLVKLDKASLNDYEKDKLVVLINSLNDIERVGDHADNISELAMYAIENDVVFSDLAREEITTMFKLAQNTYKKSLEALKTIEKEALDYVINEDSKIDEMFKSLKANHINRLNNRVCEPNAGIIFLDTINNLERIGDHASNIAISVMEALNKK